MSQRIRKVVERQRRHKEMSSILAPPVNEMGWRCSRPACQSHASRRRLVALTAKVVYGLTAYGNTGDRPRRQRRYQKVACAATSAVVALFVIYRNAAMLFGHIQHCTPPRFATAAH